MERRKAKRLEQGTASWRSSEHAAAREPVEQKLTPGETSSAGNNGGISPQGSSREQSIFQTNADQSPSFRIFGREADRDRRGTGGSNQIRRKAGGHTRSDAINPDLRRRTRREHAEAITQRAAWLPAEDRELVEAVFAHGRSVAAYVRTQRERGLRHGLTERTARRRLRRLIQRLASSRFAFVINEREGWGTGRRRVAVACVVQGLSLRQAARALGLSLHAVRRHMDAVDALYTEAHRR